jgi:hypothetical protein
MTEHVSLRIALLDKQLVDCDQRPFGRVDDIQIDIGVPGGRPRVSAILTGQRALGQRLGGLLGRTMMATAKRLSQDPAAGGATRIDPRLVRSLEPLVQLAVPLAELTHVASLERWLARHVVEPLPGAGDARD